MKTKLFLAFLTLVFMVNCTSRKTKKLPPLAQVKPVVDNYFGTKITDPYRYMENLKDTSVQRWFKQQADFSRRILNSIPGRQALIDKMKEFDSRKSAQLYYLQITDNDRYFYLKQTPADETAKLFSRDGYAGKETLLFDPEKYGTDTTKKYTISMISPSPDGFKVAFEIAPNGLESSEVLTLDLKNMKVYPDKIDRCGGSEVPVSWLPDGSAFLYNRMKSSDVHQIDRQLDSKTYLHKVETDPATDMEILSRVKYPELGIKPADFPVIETNKNNKYIFGQLISVDQRLTIYYAPYTELTKERINWKHLFKPEDEVYRYYATDKEIYVYTAKGASNFKLLKTSLINPNLETAEVIVPEDINGKLSNFRLNKDGLYYTLSENGVKERLFFLRNGEKAGKEIELPFVAGSVYVTAKGIKFSDAWVYVEGWTSDYQRYRYSPQNKKFTLENLSSKAEYPEYANLMVEELMVTSHDGVKVPLSLVYKKGIKRDGTNPVFFYGYGAYGMSMNPFFSREFLLWTNGGGILAIPHVRGGGELGNQWYKGGYKTTKPNTWKDLIACAEYLVKENYTTPGKIAINSASAGGILIGRAMTERPDLFAVAIPQVGCLNSVRMEESPNGPDNIREFGTVKDSLECKALIEMDSYLHIKDGVKYPATLITAGMNDPRVIAWVPGKFAARLQAANASDKPILFFTDYEAGHGIGNTKTKYFESMADVFSFAFWQTGNPDYQVK